MKGLLTLLAIAVVLMLGMTTFSTGQNPSQPMFNVTISDNSCSMQNWICETDGTGCEATTVRVPSTGSYYLSIWIQCSPPQENCGGCFACAHLIRASDAHDMFGIQHTACTNCGLNVGPQTLDARESYRLFVCKASCDQDCDNCSASCTAYAQVHG